MSFMRSGSELFTKKRCRTVASLTLSILPMKNYTPEKNAGIDFETAMGRIHAITNEGEVIRNVEVFRRVYEALGMGWIYGCN